MACAAFIFCLYFLLGDVVVDMDSTGYICKAPIIVRVRKSTNTAIAVRGSCNSWNCPRCSQIRARREYARVVNGIDQILELHNELFFMTFTALGGDMTPEVALQNYGKWTNKFMTAYRTRAKRENHDVFYFAVTELQSRGHPHTHMLTTYAPEPLYTRYTHSYAITDGKRERTIVATLGNVWIEQRLLSAGFGEQYDIQQVVNPKGLARYIAKYLFKNHYQTFPKGWRRIRYSQNFPALEQHDADSLGDDYETLVLASYKAFRDFLARGLVVSVRGANAVDKELVIEVLKLHHIRAVVSVQD